MVMTEEKTLEIKESELEALIEKKVEEKLGKSQGKVDPSQENSSSGLDRREFLKRSGLGALGLGALLSPVSALSVKDSSFDVFTGTSSSDLTNYLSVGQGGPVNIQNTSLDLNNQDINGVNQINGSDASSLTTLNEVNNNADVPNADYADNAGDADTVDGQHASDFSTPSSTNNYRTVAPVPHRNATKVTWWSNRNMYPNSTYNNTSTADVDGLFGKLRLIMPYTTYNITVDVTVTIEDEFGGTTTVVSNDRLNEGADVTYSFADTYIGSNTGVSVEVQTVSTEDPSYNQEMYFYLYPVVTQNHSHSI